MDSMFTKMNLPVRLNHRRLELGLSCATLAQRAGLSLRTVQRLLSGKEQDPAFSTVSALAQCLAVSIHLREEDGDAVRRRQAEQKADRLMAMVQGTSALEVQAIPDDALRSLRERTVHELLAGSRRRLWED